MEAIGVRTLCVFTLFITIQAQFSNVNVRPRWPPRFPFRPWRPVKDRLMPLHDKEVSTQPRFVLLAPNLLRLDSEENIYLEAYGLSDPLTVTITAHNFPEKTQLMLSHAVLLDAQNDYHALTTITLDSALLDRDKLQNQYVYLKADFGAYVAEVVVMVSFHSGYIFIQTDKPLYNPGDAGEPWGLGWGLEGLYGWIYAAG
ncbi:hypothetical protein GJAV_G00142010 [Gymnothorax javanicus]|nr:hypothetical protein GJAV_G00142010 [Gymnothorax javanicus]